MFFIFFLEGMGIPNILYKNLQVLHTHTHTKFNFYLTIQEIIIYNKRKKNHFKHQYHQHRVLLDVYEQILQILNRHQDFEHLKKTNN
jgi:hypothetical protein